MNNNPYHWWLYVLKLEQNKWYIGITSQTPEKRFQEHSRGRKSYWTEKYKPISIADQKFLGDLSYDEAKAYEDKITRLYMRKKGVNNVRGGTLTQTSDFIVRFGYIWDGLNWEMLTVIILQLLVIFYLVIDKYFL